MSDGDKQSGERREALHKIEALVSRLAWRVRAQRALEWATTAAVLALLGWMVGLALYKTGWIGWEQLRLFALGGGGLVLLIAALGAAMRLDPVKLAQRIDRSHQLHDRLSTALALSREPSTKREEAAFRAAQLEDAGRHTAGVELKRAAPWRWPQELALCAAVLICAVGLHAIKAPSHKRELASPTFKVEHHRILDKATLQLERERLEQLRELVKNSGDPRAQELVDELDALLDAVEQQKISEKEFLGKLDEIQKKLVDQYKEQDTQQAELREKLKEAAEQLEKEAAKELKEQKEVAALLDALKKEDMKGAQEALEALADKLKDEDLSTKDLEQMAKLIEKFADKIDPTDPKLKKLFEENESKLKDLISKLEKKGDKLSDEEKQRLNRAKEELAKLNQEKEASGDKDATSRQLKQLKREADEMAQKMRQEAKEKQKTSKQKMSEQGQGQPKYRQEAAQKAKKAAEQAGEQDKQQKGEQARKDAQKQLEELRESMQRQRGRGEQQDKQQEQQVEDFMRRAQGQDKQDQGEQQGKQGQQQKGQQGQQQGQAQAGEEQQGQGQKDGQAGENKEGKPGEDGQQGQQAGKQGEQGKDGQQGGQQGKDGQPGEGQESSEDARAAGKGEGSRELGEETDLNGKRVDSKVDGKQLNQGQSRSEIIKSASEKGFATRQYKDVYGDYSSVVEEVMEKENVPKGYRYYVKRYFQLIKPRGQE